jgi:hypothetical protein
MKDRITPTRYVEMKCEVCDRNKPCFSVLCSWPSEAEFLCGNRMICIGCLEGANSQFKEILRMQEELKQIQTLINRVFGELGVLFSELLAEAAKGEKR